MSSASPSLLATRRSMAIGLWSLLVAAMALVSSDFPSSFSVLCLLIVSIFSSVAMLLIEDTWSIGRGSVHLQRNASAAVAIAIPFSWAALLGAQGSLFTLIAFGVLSMIPVTVVWLILLSRAPLVPQQFNDSEVPAPMPVEQIPPVSLTAIPHELHISSDDGHSELSDDELDESCVEGSLCDIEESVSPDVTQWLTRTLTADGEIIEGGVRIDFAEGQRDATVHVSFCPPLQSIPEVTTEDLDGLGVEIRVAATFAFGARLTIRRRVASHERGPRIPAETCRIGFVAIAAPIRKAA